MSLALRACAVLVVTLLGLSGCGSSGPTSTTTSGPTTIDITIKGGTVNPDGTQVKVKAGQPVTLHITADTAGELHVHSSPEQHIEYAAGTTDKTITLDQPGVVDIEDHALNKLVVQLQVR